MLYPGVLPLISMFDAFFKDGKSVHKKLKLFYIAFALCVIFPLRFYLYSNWFIASSSGRYSPSGCSRCSPGSQFSVSPTRTLPTLHTYLAVPTVTKDSACCRSVSTGNTFRVASTLSLYPFRRNSRTSSDIFCACKLSISAGRFGVLTPSFLRVVFCGVYYGNIWDSKNFPFVSHVARLCGTQDA